MPTDDWASTQTHAIGKEIQRLRKQLGLSAQQLSDLTVELGHRVTRTSISELENARRRTIGVHEVSILAEALGVAPVELIFPMDPKRSETRMSYLPFEYGTADDGLRWFIGMQPGETHVTARLRLDALQKDARFIQFWGFHYSQENEPAAGPETLTERERYLASIPPEAVTAELDRLRREVDELTSIHHEVRRKRLKAKQAPTPDPDLIDDPWTTPFDLQFVKNPQDDHGDD